MIDIGEHAYQRLEALIHQTSQERGHGSHAVIVFAKQEQYYDYVSYFYPESDREYGMSAGMHIKKGYRHTVLNGPSLRTLVHEMAHNMVVHRPLPRWLNEGLAQTVEDMVPGYRPPLITARQKRIYQRFWSWKGLDGFWEGSAFYHRGSQRASYALAEVLFRNLLNDSMQRKRLSEFLAKAHHQDAGAVACEECFGCSLGSLVEEFLGEGDWERGES